MNRTGRILLAGLSTFALLSFLVASQPAPSRILATEPSGVDSILAACNFQGGLIVHLGCGDGRFTAGLAGENRLVHGLDADPKNVEAARHFLQSKRLYGTVSIDRFSGSRLPYVDNLVNLIVAEDLGQITNDELQRVLAPNGVAYIRSDGAWKKTAKPWPAEIDQWTHYLHDATNNAVAQDKRVGPPRHYQWIGTPDYLRHHDHLSGLSAMVSAGGRLFYIMDLGPRWSVQMPPQWTLVARDAFNGIILWQRPIEHWHPHLWPLKRGPAQLMRRLVAVGDRVYVTLGVGQPVSVLEAATGQALQTLPGTEGAEEMIVADGMAYVLVNPELDAYKTISTESVDTIRSAGRDWNWDERPRRIVAVDLTEKKPQWSHEAVVAPSTLATADVSVRGGRGLVHFSADGRISASKTLAENMDLSPSLSPRERLPAGKRVYFHNGEKVVCLDASGKTVWSSKPIPRWKPMHVLFSPTLIVYDGVVLFSGGENLDPIRGGNDTMTALSADTGEVLWTAPHPPSGYASAEDLFVIDGLVWCGVTTSPRDSGVFTGRDLHTGEVKREFPPDDWRHMPHHRCYRAKATCDFILTSRTGIEFVDLDTEHWTANHWVRGSCNYGILPCNGLVYAPPHSCACYLLAKLSGFSALAAERKPSGNVGEPEAGERLEPGPAYSDNDLSNSQPSTLNPQPSSDWPTYRHDPLRSGSTAAAVPSDLKRIWESTVGGKLSPVTVADGKLYVSSIDTHTLHALDTKNGKPLWTYTAGGRIDSPPTIWQGRVLFGSADGYVYSLRASDGALAWRFRAAPLDQRLMAAEQIESVWPVHGSVLVRDGVVYCVAGRAMWLDGGLRMLRLDAATGRLLSETVLNDKEPGTDKNLQNDLRWPNLPVALPDILSCDGRHVYMRSQPFKLDGTRPEAITPRDYRDQQGETDHLFSPTGFLDDSYWHRSYWMWGKSFISGAGGWYLAGYQAPAGNLLAVDDSKVYGFGYAPLRFTGTPKVYHVFACDRQPEIHTDPKVTPRKQGTSIYGPVVPSRLKYDWSLASPVIGRGLVVAGDHLFVAGPRAVADENEVYLNYGSPDVQAGMAQQVAAFEGRRGAVLVAASKSRGEQLAAYELESPPVFDGLAAAGARLFLATMDGKVLCLGSGNGAALPAVADAKLSPLALSSPGPARLEPTPSHPDFQQLTAVRIGKSDLGYQMQSAPREIGLALKKLSKPITSQATFSVKLRPTPGAGSPDKPGNGFIAFGDGSDDEQLIKCGVRISGKVLMIVPGPLAASRGVSKKVGVNSDEVAELQATVDLESRKVTASIHGESIEMPLERPIESITWVGVCLTSVTTDFGPVEVVVGNGAASRQQ